MGYTIKIGGALVSMSIMDFNCPFCEASYTEEEYYPQLEKSKSFIIYKKCKRCKESLGITLNYKCDVVVWLKKDEKK